MKQIEDESNLAFRPLRSLGGSIVSLAVTLVVSCQSKVETM
jgi:hypothetical protein